MWAVALVVHIICTSGRDVISSAERYIVYVEFVNEAELDGRLELYMKQNHENVERAESELNTLHEDMEQTLDLQRRLAQR
jgi:hypothetical protein